MLTHDGTVSKAKEDAQSRNLDKMLVHDSIYLTQSLIFVVVSGQDAYVEDKWTHTVLRDPTPMKPNLLKWMTPGSILS